MVYKKKYRKRGMRVSKAVKAYVKSRFRREIENKQIDTTFDNQGTTLSGAISSLSHPDQGLNDNNRIGDVIRPMRLQIQYDMNLRTTATLPCMARVIFFQWKNNSTPTVSDILSYSGTVNIVNSPYNNDTKMNYRILNDRTYDLNTVSTEQIHYKKNIYRKKFLKQIQIPGTLGSSSGFNKLYVIWCDNTGGGTEGVLFSAVIRLFYEDA